MTNWGRAALALAVAWAVAVTVVDVRWLRIPPVLALAGGVTALVAVAAHGQWRQAALGAAGMTALYLALRLVSPSGLGGGDLRLAPTCGALAGTGGLPLWVASAVAPFAVTALVGLAVLLTAALRGRTEDPRHTAVAHGPSMVWVSVAALVLAS